MLSAIDIIIIGETIILLMAIILGLIYIIPIIFLRRFQNPSNILTGNVCLAIVFNSSFFVVYDIVIVVYPSIFKPYTIGCYLFIYLPASANFLTVYALAMISINRFFVIIYPQKSLFKKKSWSFISVGLYYMVVFILPLPRIASVVQQCIHMKGALYWINVYDLVMIVILPLIIIAIFNAIIILKVRSSSRRIHTTALASTAAVDRKQQNARDIHLLKHMLFILIVFIMGWGPLYIYLLSVQNPYSYYWLYVAFQILPMFSVVIDLLDLFLYNYDMRQYYKARLLN